MTAEWLGLVMNVWLLSPLGAVNALGDPSWHKRETAQTVAAVIGRSEAGDYSRIRLGRISGASWWAVHVHFWQPFAWSEWGNGGWNGYREEPIRPHMHAFILRRTQVDPEIRRRAARARRESRLYGTDEEGHPYLPGG